MTVVPTGVGINTLLNLLVIDMRADAMFDLPAVTILAVDMLADVGTSVVTTAGTGLEFIVGLAYVVKMLAGTIIGGAPGVGIELNTDNLAAAMTALEVVLSATSKDSFLFC